MHMLETCRTLGCYRLANYHEIIKTDHPTAAKIYKMSCDEMNYGHGCYRYATFAFLGRGKSKTTSSKMTKCTRSMISFFRNG